MKILLAAVNAKFIHSNPAVYSLRGYYEACGANRASVSIAEYTINDRYSDILSDLLRQNADVYAFSVYIWNAEIIRRLLKDLRAIHRDRIQLWVGGPEAGNDPQTYLQDELCNLCMIGEGEISFTTLCDKVADPDFSQARSHIPGIAFCSGDGLTFTPPAPLPSMDALPFLYHDLTLFDHRILYYESSRGCPFRCAYCLSGKDHGARYRDLTIVCKELQFFLDHEVKQVKFVDRTFNANHEHAMRIWRYIKDHDNHITNFHFEIEADLITDEEIRFLQTLRPGLIQMEIGVQSTHPKTLQAIHRNPNIQRIAATTKGLLPQRNINLHLDLIAGLPYETLEIFKQSFNDIYALTPDQFQLGFLKVLKGTELYDKKEDFGLIYSEAPPYEILQTKWISAEQLLLLHDICDMVEMFYNTRFFMRSLPLIEALFADAFSFYQALSDYYLTCGYHKSPPASRKRYDILLDFASRYTEGAALEQIRERLRFDKALHFNPSRRMEATDTFAIDDVKTTVQIDYKKRSPVTGEASYQILNV